MDGFWREQQLRACSEGTLKVIAKRSQYPTAAELRDARIAKSILAELRAERTAAMGEAS